jgi:hypothetical protein
VTKSLEVTFTEWSAEDFTPIASKSFEIQGCELAPHDMALTENCVVMNINAMKGDQTPFLLCLKGPAGSLAMDWRAPISTWVFPRPTAEHQFEPFPVKVPPCFLQPTSRSLSFQIALLCISFGFQALYGRLGGFAPDFARIPVIFMWRLEIDPKTQTCVSLDISPGSANVCEDFVLVHPKFNIRKAENVYVMSSNVIGDSTAPNGYAKLKVEIGSTMMLPQGESNSTRKSMPTGLVLVTSWRSRSLCRKKAAILRTKEEAFLLGMVKDPVRKKNSLAVFDLERDL